jgi:hypothetical protein
MTQSRFNAFFLSLAEAGHRGAATLAAVALAIALAGCGGGDRLSKSQYEQHLNSDSQAIKKAIEPLSTTPASMEELVSKLKVGEAQLREAADDLDGIKPPKDVEKDNATLAKGLRTFADELGSFRKAAEKKDPQLLRETFAKLQSSHALEEVRAATNDMKKKGYNLGNFS